MWQIYTRLEHPQKAIGSKLFREVGNPYFRKQEKYVKTGTWYSVLEKIKVSMQFYYAYAYLYISVYVCLCVHVCVYIYTHIFVLIFKIYYNIISFRKLSLARVFTLKLNRAKSSEAVISLQQKLKFKRRQPAGVFRAVFFCSFTQETTFYWSTGITSLQSLLKWSNCLLPLN